MELSLVLIALRRRWWLIVLFMVLGGAVGSVYAPKGEVRYESRTVLLISRPGDANISQLTDPDRYIIGQLDILRSQNLADEVREAVNGEVSGPGGRPVTADDIAAALTVSQVPKTDIVNLHVAWSDPESAQLLAHQYADTYLRNLTRANEPAIQTLTESRTVVQRELDEINRNLAETRTEWVEDHPAEGLPDLEVLDPVNAAERAYQQSKLERLDQAIDQLTYQPTGTEVVQDAGLPSAPISTSRSLVPFGVVGGMLLGVAAAVVLANVSQVVEDDAGFEAILGVPPVGRISAAVLLAQGPDTPIDALPARLRRVIQEVCVRADAFAGDKHALSIAVVGSERNVGTPVIVGEVMRYFAGAAPVVAADRAPAEKRRSSPPTSLRAREAEIEDLVLSIVSVRDGVAIAQLDMAPDRIRRDQVEPLVDAMIHRYGVSVFDGGALLGSAAALRLCDVVDAIVLCLPSSHQNQRRLETIAGQLRDLRGKVLPLVVHSRRRVRRAMRSEQGAQATSVRSMVRPDEAEIEDHVPQRRAPEVRAAGSARLR